MYIHSDISWRMYHTLTMLYHAVNPIRSYSLSLQVKEEITNRITWGTILQDTIIATLDEGKKNNLREEIIKNKHVIKSTDESTSLKAK